MKKGIWKKACTAVMTAVMLAAAAAPQTSFADSRKVVTLGADLNEAQQKSILKYFGVDLNKVDVIYVTNQDERDHLGSHVPLEQIGTRTISCAYVQPKAKGGIQVKTANFNWVTSNMIASALSTSGVKHCDVIAAAPFEVSGTGALTGAIMAYEAASGETLKKEKKDTAVQEIVTTSQVAETMGQQQATQIVNDIKIQIIEEQVDASESELIDGIVDDVIDSAYDNPEVTVRLSDEDREALRELADSIAQQHYEYEDVKDTLERVERNTSENAAPDINVNVNIDNSNQNSNEQSANANQNTDVNQNQDQSNEGTQELSDDSILMNTDDAALGDDVIMDATAQEAVPAEAPAIEQEPATEEEDLPFEIVTQDAGGIDEDGTELQEAPAPAETEPAEEPAPADNTPAEEQAPADNTPEEELLPADNAPAEEPAPADTDLTEEPAPEETVPAEEPAPEEETAPADEQAQEEPAPEAPAEAPVIKIGNETDGRAFDGFALRIYTGAGLVPASGTVVIRDEGGNEVLNADLSDTSAWAASEVKDQAVLADLGMDAANCICIFTNRAGLADSGSFTVSAEITFADADESGRPVPGTEKTAASAEAKASYKASALSIAPDTDFEEGGLAVIRLALPDGASAQIRSSDTDVAAPYETSVGGSESSAEAMEGAPEISVGLLKKGEAVISADIFDSEGGALGTETLTIAVF